MLLSHIWLVEFLESTLFDWDPHASSLIAQVALLELDIWLAVAIFWNHNHRFLWSKPTVSVVKLWVKQKPLSTLNFQCSLRQVHNFKPHAVQRPVALIGDLHHLSCWAKIPLPQEPSGGAAGNTRLTAGMVRPCDLYFHRLCRSYSMHRRF